MNADTCAALEVRLSDASNIAALQLLASQFEGNPSVPVFRECDGAAWMGWPYL